MPNAAVANGFYNFDSSFSDGGKLRYQKIYMPDWKISVKTTS